MSNYRRLISYMYAYEGDVKGKNVGFAKVEVRNGQCKIQVSVKKIFESGNDVGVYLLSKGQEVLIGRIYIRNGNGEFRANVKADNVEMSGISMDQIYGLTVHDIKNPWVSYTTIWEDAVKHTAQLDLQHVTSENCRQEETEIDKVRAIVQEIEKEVALQEIQKEQIQKNGLQTLKDEIENNEYLLPDMQAGQKEESKGEYPEKEMDAEESVIHEIMEDIVDIGENDTEGINGSEPQSQPMEKVQNEKVQNVKIQSEKMQNAKMQNAKMKNEAIGEEATEDVSDSEKEKVWMDQIGYNERNEQGEYIQRSGTERRRWECEPQDIRHSITEPRSRRRGTEKSFPWSAIPLSAAKQLVELWGGDGMQTRVAENSSLASNNEKKKKNPQEGMGKRKNDDLAQQITFHLSKENPESKMDASKWSSPSKMEEKSKEGEQPIYVKHPQSRIQTGHLPILVEFKQDVKRLKELENEENSQPDHAQQLWDSLKKIYPKMQEFDYESGCEILAIKPKDIGLLPIENWILGSNSFLLHGYYNYRYLILVQLTEKDGKKRYLLGVPGHYYNNDKYMASMFGFPGFVLSKKQPTENGRFGYWYTSVTLDAEEF